MYDRRALTAGVVHIGVGSFHRSHQAVYFDDLARRRPGDGWAVTGVGLHRADLQRALARQDGLYTVVSRTPTGDA
jgi:mannitol 2-dehydrogenase